jgi:CheY-like chemotaxis protein
MEAEVLRRTHDLQLLNSDLEAANAAKSEFLSRISHELRTPLTVILGYGELLELTEMGDEQRRWTSLIYKAGKHLLKLVEDILDVSRLEAGNMRIAVEPISVADLILDTLDLVRPLAAARGISLHSRLNAAASSYVLADNQRLKQVLINLISNAIKYNRPDGEVRLEVSRGAGDRIWISITDTGLGLSEAEQERLFAPFERLDAAERGIEGTGLGLALSRHLTIAMGGEMTVRSQVGAGSTFAVGFASVVPAVVEERPPAVRPLLAQREYGQPRSILYVEDTVANVTLIEHILKQRPGVTLIPAMLGGTALELAREHRPDMILLDLHLPDLPGREVMRRLQADPATRGIPVVVLSADATKRHLDQLLAAGARAYLTKPIGVIRLLEVIDQTLLDPA